MVFLLGKGAKEVDVSVALWFIPIVLGLVIWWFLKPNAVHSKKVVKIIYTNYKDVTSDRRIKPIKIHYGKTKWHDRQWLLRAYDLDKQAIRDFALRDILAWRNIK